MGTRGSPSLRLLHQLWVLKRFEGWIPSVNSYVEKENYVQQLRTLQLRLGANVPQ